MENRPAKRDILYLYIQASRGDVQHIDREVCSIGIKGGKERKILIIGAAAVLGAVLMLNILLWNSKDTYTIRDGNRVLIRTTAARDPARILEEAGIALDSGDILDVGRTEGGPVLQILRQQTITVDYYGETMEVTSYGETVQQLLHRLELPVREEDQLSHPNDAKTYDGMVLRVYRIVQQEQTYTVMMQLETIYCSDPTLPIGTHLVLTQGRNGELLRRARVTYINGREVSREILCEEVIVQPITGIIAIGTAEPMKEQEEVLPMIGDGLIRLPTGEVLTYSKVISSLATAYCDKGLTATGTQARVGAIAVDPEYIPYGTRMFILSKDGEYIYGIATAEDCGSKEHIYGTRIDLHYDTEYECVQFGARMCWVYILC